MLAPTPERTVARLSLYRRFLRLMRVDGMTSVYSHQLADVVRITPAQVRRDLMTLGYVGSPRSGYNIDELIRHIDAFFNIYGTIDVVLVGIGNVGRAMLSYFKSGDPHINIVAGFDVDPGKVGTVINGCPCYSIDRLSEIVKKHNVKTGILTVPSSNAQNIAELMAEAKIKGILNFAPVRLKLPADVFVEDVDITMNLEKVFYFSS